MTYAPRISIIMPIYNAERSLSTSIQSITSQSYASWELILVNDGSTDRSHAIAQAHAVNDKRISVYSKPNGGPSRARNYGITLSHGEYVAFLDADDQWGTHRLRDLVYRFQTMPKTGVLFTRTRFVDAQTGKQGVLTPHYDKLTPITLLAENPVCSTSNIMCRQSVLKRVGGFKSGLDYAEDQDWLLRVALDGTHDICGVNAEGLYYASAPDSQSSDLAAMHKGWRRMVEDAAKTYPQTVNRLRSGATAKFYRYLARRALRMRTPKSALKYLITSFRHDPALILRQPKRTALTWLGTLLSLTNIKLLEELAAR